MSCPRTQLSDDGESGETQKTAVLQFESNTLPLSSLPTKYYQIISKDFIERTGFYLQMDRQALDSPSILRGPRWTGTRMFKGVSGMGKMLTDVTRVFHYQVGGCFGGNICFRCDSKLTGA